jgi:hypothetical protein
MQLRATELRVDEAEDIADERRWAGQLCNVST